MRCAVLAVRCAQHTSDLNTHTAAAAVLAAAAFVAGRHALCRLSFSIGCL